MSGHRPLERNIRNMLNFKKSFYLIILTAFPRVGSGSDNCVLLWFKLRSTNYGSVRDSKLKL